MPTITKKELMDRITGNLNAQHPRSPIKAVHVKRVVQRFLDTVVEELAKGNRLEFREFGIFDVRSRSARQAQNPKTLEKVTVPACRTVKFKAGRLMKETLTGNSQFGA